MESLAVREGLRFKSLLLIDLAETCPLQHPCHQGALSTRHSIALDNLLLFRGLFPFVRGFNHISPLARLNHLIRVEMVFRKI